MEEFKQYMEDTVTRERQRPSSKDEKWPNLISALIRANDEAKKDDSKSRARLSDEEVRGNIFVFIVGGLETTAVTLGYALALLALSPEVQDWIIEELDEVLEDVEFMDYTKVFPKMKRIMAVMVSLFLSIHVSHTRPKRFLPFKRVKHGLMIEMDEHLFSKIITYSFSRIQTTTPLTQPTVRNPPRMGPRPTNPSRSSIPRSRTPHILFLLNPHPPPQHPTHAQLLGLAILAPQLPLAQKPSTPNAGSNRAPHLPLPPKNSCILFRNPASWPGALVRGFVLG